MGGKTSTTTQQVQIPAEVLARYNAINARAESAAGNPFQIYSTDPSKFVAQLNQQQQTGISNVNAAAGAYQPYFASATDATKAGMASAQPGQLDATKYMNPFQQEVIDATMNRMRQEQAAQQSSALGTAISSGAFGGDRAGIAAANLAQQQGLATGQTLAELNAQNYLQGLQTAQQQQGLQLGATQADLARLLSGGQQLAGLGQASQMAGLQGAEAQIAAGTLGQQTEQAGLSALYNQFQQQQAYPFQVAQFLANIGMGTGALSGSTTTTTVPRSLFGFESGGRVSGLKPARSAHADGGGVAGPYSAAVGSLPGVGSYVPPAYLPVGDLLMADDSMVEDPRARQADEMQQMAQMAQTIAGIGGFSSGGLARAGYQTAGAVREEEPAGLAGNLARLGSSAREALLDMLPEAPEPRAGGVGPAGNPNLPGGYGLAGNLALMGADLGRATRPDTTGLADERPAGLAPMIGAAPVSDYRPAPAAPAAPVRMSDAELAGLAGAAINRAPQEVRSMEEIGLAPAAGIEPVRMAETFGVSPEMRPAGLGAADVAAPSTGTAAGYVGVAGAGKGYTDLIRPDGTVERREGARNWRNNNPGNIEFGPFAQAYGAIGSDGRFAVFPSYEAGRAAKGALLFESEGYAGKSIADAIARYAPPSENDTGAYVAAVAGALGVDPNTPLSALNPAQREAMLTAMERVEGGGAGNDYTLGNYRTYERGAEPQTGLGAAAMPGQKAYEDRNFIGRFMYDPETNKLNPTAVMSVLAGIGRAAEAPTISPIGAILSGIGAGATTYAGLQKQQADVAAANIANMRQVAQDTLSYNAMYGANLTPAEYARAMNMPVSLPPLATAEDILSGAYRPTTREGMRELTYPEFQSGVVEIGGRVVRMQDDPVSLRRFIMDNGMAPPNTPIAEAVARAERQLAAIEATGGMTVDATTGEQFQIPGYTAVGDVQAKAAADREASAAFLASAPEVIDGAARMLSSVTMLKGVYQRMESGATASTGAAASALLDAVDPNNLSGWKGYDLTNPADYEIALKGMGELMAARLNTLPGGAPAAEIGFLQSFTPGPTNQPESIKKLLAIAEAEARYKMDLYNSYDPNPKVHGTDVNAYSRKFADGGKRFSRYVEEAYKNMPRFAGEAISPSEAAELLRQRGYVQNPDGTWSKPNG